MAKILSSRPWSQIWRTLAASAALFEVMIRKFVKSFILGSRADAVDSHTYLTIHSAPTSILHRSFHACIIFDTY
jgi:hypothetical protein